jgi:hemolysin III
MGTDSADRMTVAEFFTAPVKPRLRGLLHEIAFFTSIPAGLALVAFAQTTSAKVAAVVYALGVSGLYGTSAAYHRGNWSERGRRWMRRLDHSMIFVLIAATYTPICVLGMQGRWGLVSLITVWSAATLGVTLGLAGIAEKHGIGFTLYLIMGWFAAVSFPALAHRLGPSVVLIVIGGLAYTVGAIILGARWPDPRPDTFGYHEVWHTFTLVAGACFTIVVWGLVLSSTTS